MRASTRAYAARERPVEVGAVKDDDDAERKPARGGMRWGLLSLGFLAVALTCVLVSNSNGSYTAITLLGLLVGFSGAAYCSYRGLKGFNWLPR
jgi:hypothetical protein